jgi:hypothetical protein
MQLFFFFFFFLSFRTVNDIFPLDFASRGGPRSYTQTPQIMRGNDNSKINTYIRAGEIFKLLKNKLLLLSVGEKVEDDSFDYLTVWQIVSKILCALYSKLLMSYCSSLSVSVVQYCEIYSDSDNNDNRMMNNNIVWNNYDDNHSGHSHRNNGGSSSSSNNKNRTNNNNNNNNKSEDKTHSVRTASKEYVFSTLTEYYSLLETVLDVLTVRVRYTNQKFLSEYLSSISAVIQSTSKIESLPCLLPIVQSVCVLGKGVRKLKRKICSLLLDTARQIRDSGERTELCCTGLCCAVCYAVLYAVLCCMLCCAVYVPCCICAVLCCALQCSAVLCCAVLCAVLYCILHHSSPLPPSYPPSCSFAILLSHVLSLHLPSLPSFPSLSPSLYLSLTLFL